jgi:hypothetical protein
LPSFYHRKPTTSSLKDEPIQYCVVCNHYQQVLPCLVLAAAAAATAGASKEDRIKGASYGALISDAFCLGSHYEYDAHKIKQAYSGTISKYYAPGEQMGGQTHGVGWGSRN